MKDLNHFEERIPKPLKNWKTVRPSLFDDFIGQKKYIHNLKIFIASAKKRDAALDHVIISGPPGLGKTTLARIIAQEMQVPYVATTAPALEKTGDLISLLTSLEKHSILFIDEIHRLRVTLEETLYSAMEDQFVDILIGQGTGAKTVKLYLKPFTLIGATTRPGLINTPLLNRFGIDIHMDFYDTDDLVQIVFYVASQLGIPVEKKAALEIASKSRGTPRILQKLLKRVWDFSLLHEEDTITLERAKDALDSIGISELGLTQKDRELISILHQNYRGGPVGISTLAIALGESEDSIEDIIEPFLIREGFLARTPRGRILTPKAYEFFHLPVFQDKVSYSGNHLDTESSSSSEESLW